ncbi:MAG: 3-oxoacyl-ACP reductase FabG [Holosporales bacterium]|jgi:3-oxoacyl-[acyl-carrier protein] reductase|nr:3-oxoacyl-ACP reductase FabG [Holosporales bacterium]
MLFSLEGRRALITGASGAIGRAIAISFTRQGADIVITGTRKEVLLELSTFIKEDSGRKAHVMLCDLSNTTSNEIETLVEKAVIELNGLDILVNNAGINKDMLFAKMKESDLDDVMAVNLNAVFSLTKKAVSAMSAARYGRIINISSVVGFMGNIGQVNYCASKAAVIGMSKAIALEVARKGITVNCIAPGAIESPMIKKLSDMNREKFLNKIPMQKIGKPEDVAGACCYLASEEASYITGQTIHINGGMLMV